MSQAEQNDNLFARIIRVLIPRKGDRLSMIIRKSSILTAAAVLVVLLIKIPIDTAQRARANNVDDSVPTESLTVIESTVSSTTTVPKSSSSSKSSSSTVKTTTVEDTEPEVIDLTPVVNTPLNVDFDYLQRLNPDTRAWIKITGTLLNSEVLQSTYDFDYYIDHDFYGNYNEYSPCIFSSDINRWDGSDDNLILFSHKLNSGYGFGSVVYYVPNDASSEPLAFYKTHPTILFQRPGGPSETYKIFAGIIANTDPQYGEVFEYISKIYFYGVDDFNNYMIELMDRSWFYTDVDLQYGDKFLTLSTCYWPIGRNIPTRWVLFARKVRDGESEYVDTSVAQRNYGAKLFEYYYQVVGGQWHGSNWDTSKLLSY